jgi:electron transfer flavoprotein beta subunit
MSTAYQIVVCGSIVPDLLQTLEPVASPTGPALKNEMMLPAVLDPNVAASRQSAANFLGVFNWRLSAESRYARHAAA